MSDVSYVFFDIDNTLYSTKTNISKEMGTRIHRYFVGLGLDEEEANELHLSSPVLCPRTVCEN